MQPSKLETSYIRALSRPLTVEAYKNWKELSEVESMLIKLYINEESKILDLGCGTGRIPNTIKVKSENYLGIDYSHEMICGAKELNPNLNFLCEDILQPSINTSSFDAVLLMGNVIDMLHPLKRREALFALVKTYLDAKGVFIFSSHLLPEGAKSGYFQENYHGVNVNNYRSSFSQLCSEVENNGFEIKIAARDYRVPKADWAYIAAKVKAY